MSTYSPKEKEVFDRYISLMRLVRTRQPVENFTELAIKAYNDLTPYLNGDSKDYRRAMKIASLHNLISRGWDLREAYGAGSYKTIVFADKIFSKFMSELERKVSKVTSKKR